jgi:hypothetical protein
MTTNCSPMKGGSIKGGGFFDFFGKNEYKKYNEVKSIKPEKWAELTANKQIHIDILDDKNYINAPNDAIKQMIDSSLTARYSDKICKNSQPGNFAPMPAATNAAPTVSMGQARPDIGMRGPPPPAGMDMGMRGPPPPAGPSIDDDDLLAPPPGGMRGGKGRRRRSSSKKSKKVKKGGKTKKTARKSSKKSKKARKTKIRKSANNSAGVLKRIKNTQNMQMAAAAGYM